MAKDSWVVQFLVGIGLSRDFLIARLQALEEKYPDHAVPIQEVENLIRQWVTMDGNNLNALFTAMASDLTGLFTKGKGPIEKDPSALA